MGCGHRSDGPQVGCSSCLLPTCWRQMVGDVSPDRNTTAWAAFISSRPTLPSVCCNMPASASWSAPSRRKVGACRGLPADQETPEDPTYWDGDSWGTFVVDFERSLCLRVSHKICLGTFWVRFLMCVQLLEHLKGLPLNALIPSPWEAIPIWTVISWCSPGETNGSAQRKNQRLFWLCPAFLGAQQILTVLWWCSLSWSSRIWSAKIRCWRAHLYGSSLTNNLIWPIFHEYITIYIYMYVLCIFIYIYIMSISCMSISWLYAWVYHDFTTFFVFLSMYADVSYRPTCRTSNPSLMSATSTSGG